MRKQQPPPAHADAPSRSKATIRERLAAAGIQPRGLSLEEAAAYLGLSPTPFLKGVDIGLYPKSVPQAGERKVWDRVALDLAMDALSGIDGSAASASDGLGDDDIEGAIGRAYPKNNA